MNHSLELFCRHQVLLVGFQEDEPAGGACEFAEGCQKKHCRSGGMNDCRPCQHPVTGLLAGSAHAKETGKACVMARAVSLSFVSYEWLWGIRLAQHRLS